MKSEVEQTFSFNMLYKMSQCYKLKLITNSVSTHRFIPFPLAAKEFVIRGGGGLIAVKSIKNISFHSS